MDILKWLAIGVGGYFLYEYLLAPATGIVVSTSSSTVVNPLTAIIPIPSTIVATTGTNDAVVGGSLPSNVSEAQITQLAQSSSYAATQGDMGVAMSVYQWNYYSGKTATSNPYGDSAIGANAYHALIHGQGLEGLIGLGRIMTYGR